MDAQSTSPKPHRVSIKQRDSPYYLWRDRFKQQCLTRIKQSRDSLVNSRRTGLRVIEDGTPEVVDDEKLIERVIAQEWKKFQEQNERAYLRDMKDVDAKLHAMIDEDVLQEFQGLKIQESNEDPFYDDILAFEEAELNSIIAAYESSQMLQAESEDSTGSPKAWPFSFPASNIPNTICLYCHKTNFHIEAPSTNQIDHSIAARCSACGFQVEGQMLERIYQAVQSHTGCSGHPLYTFEQSTGLIMLCSVCDMCEVF